MTAEYPTILRRYFSSFIDWSFVLLTFIVSSYIFHQETKMASLIRIGIAVTMVLLYEPLCTSKFLTLGQWIMRIRVRRLSDFERISIPTAYIRTFVKIFLGLISLFTVPVTKGKRAIHDFVVGSIVINANSVKTPSITIEKQEIQSGAFYAIIFVAMFFALVLVINLLCQLICY